MKKVLLNLCLATVFIFCVELLSQIHFFMTNKFLFRDVKKVSDQISSVFESHPYLIGFPKKNIDLIVSDIVFNNTINIKTNSLGARGHEPQNLDNPYSQNIAALGGSTTYGLGLRSEDTWPAQLELLLGRPYNVLNFGVIGYTSVETLIQTALHLPDKNIKYALYLTGYNDAHTAYSRNLQDDYVGFHTAAQFKPLRSIGNLDHNLGNFASAYYLAKFMSVDKESYNYTINGFENDYDTSAANLNKSIKIYEKNLISTVILCKQYGIKSIFILPFVNKKVSKNDSMYWWFIGVKTPNDVNQLISSYNHVTLKVAKKYSVPVIKVPINNDFVEEDFFDSIHLNKSGNKKFSRIIYTYITTHNL